MTPGERAAVGAALGAAVDDARPVAGGDISAAWIAALDDERRVFVKTNAGAPATMFPAEARGLGWLGAAGALRVPGVLAAEARFIVLEAIAPAPRIADFDERLGHGLAALHAAGAQRFGLDHDNFIGRLPQRNDRRDDWATFYREMRLEPQAAMAGRAGLADARLRRDLERLYARLDERVGPPEPPARLHGDLWGGNLHVDGTGAPCLIDPAAYAGHREVDLAMMRLFGGFSERVFAAYAEAAPLAPGHRERVPLYQLYFLLAHLNLFGRGYLGAVRRAIDALA